MEKKRVSVRTIIIFSIFGLCVISALIIMAVSVLLGLVNQQRYPACTLAGLNDGNSFNKGNLVAEVVIPNEDMTIYMPGDNFSGTNQYICDTEGNMKFFVFSSQYEMRDILGKVVSTYYISNSVDSCTYTQMESGEGYLNGYYLKYSTGLNEYDTGMDRGKLYSVSYEYADNGNYVVVAAVSNKMSDLNTCKAVIDMMVKSMYMNETAVNDSEEDVKEDIVGDVVTDDVVNTEEENIPVNKRPVESSLKELSDEVNDYYEKGYNVLDITQIIGESGKVYLNVWSTAKTGWGNVKDIYIANVDDESPNRYIKIYPEKFEYEMFTFVIEDNDPVYPNYELIIVTTNNELYKVNVLSSTYTQDWLDNGPSDEEAQWHLENSNAESYE